MSFNEYMCYPGRLIRSFYHQAKEKARIVRSLYTSGDISYQTLADLVIFRIRSWASRLFESGHVSYLEESGIFDIVYYNGNRRYRVRFPRNRGVRQIIYAEAINGDDVTNHILEFLGPGFNFHGIPTTPKILGFDDGLKIKYRNGNERQYAPNETIDLRPLR